MPQVSIIVPCYNHAQYLPERLKSIYSQTFRDCEVIFLDDCSTDNSIEVFENWPDKTFPTYTFYNTDNSGSPFLQWKKGLDAAHAEHIWIAESDDAAEPTLLETCMSYILSDPDVSVAHVQSVAIDKEGKRLGTFPRMAGFKNPEQWDQSFIHRTPAEWIPHMLLTCTVPNASSAVFRKSHFPDYATILNSYRFMGDWASWLRLLENGSLAYSSAPLNYFRCHPGSVSRSAKNVQQSYYERLRLTQDFRSLWSDSPFLREAILHELLEFWYYAFWLCPHEKRSFREMKRAFAQTAEATRVGTLRMAWETMKWFFQRMRGKGMRLLNR